SHIVHCTIGIARRADSLKKRTNAVVDFVDPEPGIPVFEEGAFERELPHIHGRAGQMCFEGMAIGRECGVIRLFLMLLIQRYRQRLKLVQFVFAGFPAPPRQFVVVEAQAGAGPCDRMAKGVLLEKAIEGVAHGADRNTLGGERHPKSAPPTLEVARTGGYLSRLWGGVKVYTDITFVMHPLAGICWTGGRVVEGTGLENRHTGNGIVSSNLTLSAVCFWTRRRSSLRRRVRVGMGGRVVEGARLESVFRSKA
ncbi:MAG: hypothetical protein RLZZ621_760, partial [Gemmatimonadota bacterium]